MSGATKPFSVYNYVDYRRLLAEFCKMRRTVDRSFTIRGLLASAGFTGPNYLKEVVDGKKNLSPDGAKRFADAMQLSPADASYFQLLVDFNQGRDPEKKRQALHDLTRSAKNAPAAELARDQYALLANWHNIVVREYLHAHPTSDEEIASIGAMLYPRLGKREVVKAITVLERLGLITKDEQGRWFPTDSILTTGPEVSDIAARDHHISMLELSQEAISAFSADHRYFRAITGSFSDVAYQSIVEELNRCRSRVLEIIAEDDEEKRTVRHIGMQLFPLEDRSKRTRKKAVK